LLIAGLIGYFSVYIVLDIRNYLKGRPSHAVSPHRPDDPLSHKYVERFTLNERLQHLVLVISFTLLVISGLPLSYAEAGWAKWFYTFPGSAQLRGIIHRIGAVMLMALAVWHVIYLLTPRGREQLKHLRWTRKDFADIWQMLKCYLGLSDEKPKFGRFNWIEKLEYYAVVWGTTVMVLTGLALWFEAQALTYLPLWVWHICRLIHSYEALLAFLTIIIWHLYHVHFKPGVFPMSWVWLTGKISLRHLQEEHPLEFEQLQQQVEQTAQQKP
jgi:formate dehydrogenase gamma subunit